MPLAQFNTTKTWERLQTEFRAEINKWGAEYIPASFNESVRLGQVTVPINLRGQWVYPVCAKFGGGKQGARNNLAAILQVVHYSRLADQRGIGGPFAEVGKLLALPDPDSPYVVLGINESDGIAERTAGYRRKVKETHPDNLATGNRATYDRVRKAGEELGLVA